MMPSQSRVNAMREQWGTLYRGFSGLDNSGGWDRTTVLGELEGAIEAVEGWEERRVGDSLRIVWSMLQALDVDTFGSALGCALGDLIAAGEIVPFRDGGESLVAEGDPVRSTEEILEQRRAELEAARDRATEARLESMTADVRYRDALAAHLGLVPGQTKIVGVGGRYVGQRFVFRELLQGGAASRPWISVSKIRKNGTPSVSETTLFSHEWEIADQDGADQ